MEAECTPLVRVLQQTLDGEQGKPNPEETLTFADGGLTGRVRGPPYHHTEA